MVPDFGVSQILPPQSVSAGALDSGFASVKGFRQAIVLVEIGASSSMGLTHCDLYTCNNGLTSGATLLASLAPCGTSPDQIVAFSVNLTEADEYLFLKLTVSGTGTAVISANAILLDPALAPVANSGLGKEVVLP